MKENIKNLKLSQWQRAFFHSHLLYRLSRVDYFLIGVLASAIAGFLFRNIVPIATQAQQLLFYISFFIIILILNRFAYLLSGRGHFKLPLLKRVLTLLALDGAVNLRDFSMRTGVPFDILSEAVDNIMVENYYLGYLDSRSLTLHIDDNPLKNKQCPCCKGVLSDSMVVDKTCGICGTLFYV